jgi:outer membrane protein assembly factor BamB
LVPSPVTVGGVAILCAPKGAPVYALKLGNRGTLSEAAIAWESSQREITSDVATPLVYQGKLYVLNGEKKVLSRLDPATGKADWTESLGTRAKIESSPTAADGKIYFIDHNGEVFVVSAGDQFKILHQTRMGSDSDRDTRSSIAISNGNLFIRTAEQLYCIGE